MPAPLRGNALASQLYGMPIKLGVLVATTTVNNHTTATAFNNTGDALKGKTLMLQPDSACFVYWGTTNAAAASNAATTGHVKLAADERFYISMGTDYGFVACVAVAGTTNCRVFEML